ncbi:MAG TPA: S8 family peptidase [Acidimicrobiales bacterium]|nr:S8 family peptidase [Acidimicrobiales bacterium]
MGLHIRHHRRPGGAARRTALAGALLVGALALPGAAPAGAALLPGLSGGGARYVIGDLGSSAVATVIGLVEQVGGTALEDLGVGGLVAATLTPLEVTLLGLLPGVVVTPDLTVQVQSDAAPATTRPPAAVYPQQTGATDLWSAGDEGAGVNVAVLDTGIDNLPDLAGRLVGGVDLSGGGDPFNDQYGHGTFVAGLIASNGASSGGSYLGEAPAAGLVAVKVAGASGTTDLATVIEGVGWTIAHAAAFHIRVLNLSLGYVPVESTALDPLDQAVERAWAAGIVVVASAGNDGPTNGTILAPGDDPDVVTVGAVDDLGQSAPAADQMASFSSAGPTNPDGWFKPDLVTSGRSVVSLAAPGSTVEASYPEARVGSGNFVGSGTSFSAAVTSGAVALLLAAHPSEQPNQVKAALLSSTTPGPVGNPFVDGHGELDASAAASVSGLTLTSHPGGPAVRLGLTVSLENAWAQSSWNPGNWSSLAWNGNWSSLAWNGNWSSLAWNGATFNSLAWNGGAWSSSAWSSLAWNGEQWDSLAWNGEAWSSVAWNGSSWS